MKTNNRYSVRACNATKGRLSLKGECYENRGLSREWAWEIVKLYMVDGYTRIEVCDAGRVVLNMFYCEGDGQWYQGVNVIKGGPTKAVAA